MYLVFPIELVVTESLSLMLSLESKIVIDNLDVGGPIRFKTALELTGKFDFSNNPTTYVVGYCQTPNKVASFPCACFAIIACVPIENPSSKTNS